MILLSTLMNDNIDFENTLKIAEKYPNVGLEIFPLWHKTGYDLVLEKYKKRLTQIPISVHEQYYESEHSVDDNDERYAFTTMATKKSIALTKELNGRYMVYHYNNMEVKQEEREKMLFNTRKNLQEVKRMHDGTLDFDRFIECYKKYTPHAEIVLEYYIPDEKDLVGIEKDIEELLEKGL